MTFNSSEPGVDRSPLPLETYQAMPKVDLHRHLEGSLRLSTIAEVARLYGMPMPVAAGQRPLIQTEKELPYTFENCFLKFEALFQFYRSPEIIQRFAREAVADAAVDNVRYLELRFNPTSIGRAAGFPAAEMADWVIDSARAAGEEYGVEVNLIVSLNRHESLDLAELAVELAVDRRSKGVVGIDLAGNEASYPALPFAPLLREARRDKLHLTVHAGEWGKGKNVGEAIEDLGAERIGHGIRVLEDPDSLDMALERGTAFEVCVTSNLQSGVVNEVSSHPLERMIAAGLNVTLNTDDPSISDISLSSEYRLVCEEIGLPGNMLELLADAGKRAAFRMIGD